jgi:hypothetical protein
VQARAALLAALAAEGWVPEGEAWPEQRLVRGAPPPGEVCQVVPWRSQRVAQFHAVGLAPDGGRRWLAESPTFRWPRSRPLEPEGPPLAALHALCAALEEAGWQPAGTHGEWFERRYHAPTPEREATAG